MRLLGLVKLLDKQAQRPEKLILTHHRIGHVVKGCDLDGAFFQGPADTVNYFCR